MTDYSWCETVKKGDVLRAPSGLLRIVRDVHHFKASLRPTMKRVPKTIVTFAIQHCSWTTRPYTAYQTRELARIGYRPTGIRQRLKTEFDRQLEQEIGRQGSAAECELHCCDVVGLP